MSNVNTSGTRNTPYNPHASQMPFTLRARKLQCFYCGSRSAHVANGSAQNFRCLHCEAVNYYDKNGNITDPPVEAVESTQHQTFGSVRSAQFSASPTRDSTTVFCSTCQKNQHIFRESLASYLPAETDPQYPQFLAKLDEHKAKLERQFPQVCTNCVAAVRDKIRHAGYLARSDHLRRMVEKTKKHPPSKRAYDWRSMTLTVAGLAFQLSATFQVVWHLVCFMAIKHASAATKAGNPNFLSKAMHCTTQAVTTRTLHPSCATLVESQMPVSLAAGILTFWWNNKLKKRYITSGGRLQGLLSSVTLSLLLIILRTGSFYVLAVQRFWPFSDESLAGFHVLVLLLTIIFSLLSSSCVTIDNRSRVTFTPVDILPDMPSTGPTQSSPYRSSPADSSVFATPRPYQLSSFSRQTQTFPISSLASRPVEIPTGTRPSFDPFAQPPTPPPESADDADAMDWIPSSPPSVAPRLQPRSRAEMQQQQASIRPSPFQTYVPGPPSTSMRYPRSTVSSLRSSQISNPFRQPFNKASAETQDRFYDKVTGRAPESDAESDYALDEDANDGPLSIPNRANGTSPSTTPKPRRNRRKSSNLGIAMSPARFFAPKDRERMETGLESMFDEVFRLRDDPDEADDASVAGQSEIDHSVPDTEQWNASLGSFGGHVPLGSEPAAGGAQRGDYGQKRGVFDIPRRQHNDAASGAAWISLLIIPAVILCFAAVVVRWSKSLGVASDEIA